MMTLNDECLTMSRGMESTMGKGRRNIYAFEYNFYKRRGSTHLSEVDEAANAGKLPTNGSCCCFET